MRTVRSPIEMKQERPRKAAKTAAKYGGGWMCWNMNGSASHIRRRRGGEEEGEEGEEEEEEMMRVFGPKEESLGSSSDPLALGADGHTLIVEDMVRAIREDGDPMIGLSSARNAVEVINAIFESGRTKSEVVLD